MQEATNGMGYRKPPLSFGVKYLDEETTLSYFDMLSLSLKVIITVVEKYPSKTSDYYRNI